MSAKKKVAKLQSAKVPEKKKPAEQRATCAKCGATYTPGAPHYGFCIGQKTCDGCDKEHANGMESLERCEICKGIFCHLAEDDDGCYETHACEDYREDYGVDDPEEK